MVCYRGASVRYRLGVGMHRLSNDSVWLRYRFGVGSASARYRDLSVRCRLCIGSVSRLFESGWAWHRLSLVIYRLGLISVSARNRDLSVRYGLAIGIYRLSIGSISVCIVSFSGSITSV